ncbi:MAG: outer membrane lipoprotein carrier protein LolA [Phycisphaerae bacterium]
MMADFEQLDRDARRLFASATADAGLPPGRKDALRERFIAALRASAAAPGKPIHTSPRRKILSLKVASAIAAALAVGVLCWLLLGSDAGRAKAALPEVLGNVRAARTAAYRLSMAVAGGTESRAQVWMASPGRLRMESGDGKVNILDFAAGQKLILRPSEMTASLFDLEGQRRADFDPLEQVRGLHESQGRFVARRDLDGRPTWVYEALADRQTTTIWVDPKDDLPIRIRTRSLTEDGKEFVVTLDGFTWNGPIPDEMFSLSPPPGYRIKEEERPAPDPDMLVALLRTCAGMADGAFPARLDRQTVVLLIVADMKRRNPALAPATQGDFLMGEADQTAKDAYWTCMRGLKALDRLRNGNEWRYRGAGARLGEAGAVICCWGRAGSPTRTAVMGDLKIREIDAKEIPAAP